MTSALSTSRVAGDVLGVRAGALAGRAELVAPIAVAAPAAAAAPPAAVAPVVPVAATGPVAALALALAPVLAVGAVVLGVVRAHRPGVVRLVAVAVGRRGRRDVSDPPSGSSTITGATAPGAATLAATTSAGAGTSVTEEPFAGAGAGSTAAHASGSGAKRYLFAASAGAETTSPLRPVGASKSVSDGTAAGLPPGPPGLAGTASASAGAASPASAAASSASSAFLRVDRARLGLAGTSARAAARAPDAPLLAAVTIASTMSAFFMRVPTRTPSASAMADNSSRSLVSRSERSTPC